MTEAQLQDALERWFSNQEVPFVRHPGESITGIKSIPDFTLLSRSGSPVAHFEVKLGLDVQTYTLKNAANHFEQCFKYHMQTGLPVFLGPFFVPTKGAKFYLSGGQSSSAIAAFSAIAGRANVGLMFVTGSQEEPQHWEGFQCLLRQNRAISYFPYVTRFCWPGYNQWPDDKDIKLVDVTSAANRKDRR